MSDLVPPADIERIVGAPRHQTLHLARAVSAEQTIYVLHSRECLESGIDLRHCNFSLALDNGIRRSEWVEDETVVVCIEGAFEETRLVPRSHPFWEPRWYDDQHCCKAQAQAEAGGFGLGSHYHCGRCWAETGMLGHYISIHHDDGKFVKVAGHFCCPGDCELAGGTQ